MQSIHMTGKKRQDVIADYQTFTQKFRNKKTTDDCYTPAPIYECIKNYVFKKFNLNNDINIIRPFYPGGDYQNYKYPKNCIVLDNPPFSILGEILTFYTEKQIKFFLFCPALSALSCAKKTDSSLIYIGRNLEYENGAKVPTAFVHNLNDIKVETEPDLMKEIKKIIFENKPPALPKYTYPDNVVTSANLNTYAERGYKITIKKEECTYIRGLEQQKEQKKAIFGGGLIISDNIVNKIKKEEKTKEKEKETNEEKQTWELSPKELEILKKINNEIKGE